MIVSRIAGLAFITAIAFHSTGATAPIDGPNPQEAQHKSNLRAKITTLDGGTREFTLAGVGCTQSICSRTVIKGDSQAHALSRTWLDSIAAIKDTTKDSAVLVLKDGSERHISLLKDFRVLFLDLGGVGFKKVDLANVKSVEFLGTTR